MTKYSPAAIAHINDVVVNYVGRDWGEILETLRSADQQLRAAQAIIERQVHAVGTMHQGLESLLAYPGLKQYVGNLLFSRAEQALSLKETKDALSLTEQADAK